MKNIPLRGKHGVGKCALVDDSDFDRCMEHKWRMTKKEEVITKICGSNIQMSRFIMFNPKGFEVDHKNGNRLDNRKGNLRICSRILNEMNKGIRKDNVTGFKGVEISFAGKKWEAKIKVNKNVFHIGSFDTKEDAARAYNAICKLVYGEYGWLNPID